MIIRCDFQKMHEKARELRDILPILIVEGKWQDIAEAVKISSDIWCGKAAGAYLEFSQNSVYNRWEEFIIALPTMIDKVADYMLNEQTMSLVEVDEYVADYVAVKA